MNRHFAPFWAESYKKPPIFGIRPMAFVADLALAVARSSVHAFGTDRHSPYADAVRGDVISDEAFIQLLNVEESEIEELLRNNPY